MNDNKNNLNIETIKKLKKELENRKKEIIRDLEDISKKTTKELDGRTVKFPDFGDKNDENAQEVSEYSTNVIAEKSLEKTLNDINASLKRIENKTYGICKYCSKPIGEKRMIARPVASSCIDCKNKLQN